MNVSGPAVALAFVNWRASLPVSGSGSGVGGGGGGGGGGSAGTGAGAGGRERMEGKLVVLHDELEAPLGRLSVRKGGSSARGHRGVRSCVEELRKRGVGDGEWVRVGVGVGRCGGRGREEVSAWLLREMEGWEGAALMGRGRELGALVGGIAEGRVG